MNLTLENNILSFGDLTFPCSWGRGGIRLDKKEGDGATPVGEFPFRRVFYRADRVSKPETILPSKALQPSDGWCDDPNDLKYNQYVQLPYPGRHEVLWRDDSVYDLILVVGHNDDPVIKDKGSAVFIHLCRPAFSPTDGCVALELKDLLRILQDCSLESCLIVKP
jgi:L,D-peptidoglycan transpeptidase YkuD (ErfK/YbiS/YcfS/YnhG family)